MFRVGWKKSALDELASIWLRANKRQRKEITQASHKIDQQLRDDPANFGESRPNGRRIGFEAPLGVLFKVDAPQRIVRVLQVWQI